MALRARRRVQRHASSAAKPHGHGFVAATSMKPRREHHRVLAADDRRRARPRAAGAAPRGSGAANSESSSRNRTPRWASVTSPGAGSAPPPTRPDGEIVWCGARNGRCRTSPPPWCSPATEWMRVTSSASGRVSGGRIDGRRRASIVLPVPGGPCEQQVVAAGGGDLERAERPAWPRTSARSGGGASGSATRGAGAAGGSAGGAAPREHVDQLAQVLDARDLDPVDERRLARPRRAAGAGRAARRAARPRRRRARPGRPHARPSARARRRRRSGRASSASSCPLAARSATASARSKPGTDLPQLRGREVDRDPPGRELEARVADGRADALARLAHRPCRRARRR